MKPILTNILVTLGILFLFLILVGVYFYSVDPMNLKPMIFGDSTKTMQGGETGTSSAEGFQLSEQQKQAIISAGVDPAKVPSSVSATQEACFVNALGEARVAEIKAGAVPNSIEFLKAKSCI